MVLFRRFGVFFRRFGVFFRRFGELVSSVWKIAFVGEAFSFRRLRCFLSSVWVAALQILSSVRRRRLRSSVKVGTLLRYI